MNTVKRLVCAAFIGLALLTQGCSSTQVKETNRDTTGKFDGQWSMAVNKMAALQYVQNWHMSCESKPHTMELAVNEGQVFLKMGSHNTKFQTTNIDSNGRFSFVVPLVNHATASINSASSLVAGQRRLIINGNLGKAKPSGEFIVGIKQFGWQGCRTSVDFQRMDESAGDITL